MTLAIFAFIVDLLLILFPGLVIHHALARRVLSLDADRSSTAVDEVDLLVFGLLPGLALANTVGTLLATFQFFYWWSYLAAMGLLVGWLWRDAMATVQAVGEALRRSLRSLLRGNLMVLVAVAIFLQTLAGMLVEAQVPSGNVDVWNHNFPLAKSIVDHHGFVMPQIDNMFYGTYPIFFHMFFAESLLFVDSVIAAKAANAMLYLGFLLSLLGFARHARAVAAVLISLLVINSPFFSGGAADVMTDIGRICFSGLAFVFAYQYFSAGRIYFLLASGLLAGGAIAGKYTEVLTPTLIGLSLLPALAMRKPGGWIAVVVFTAATLTSGAYPYLRNLILLQNPVYPFFFGHPGLSDAYMRALQAEIFHALDPVFRTYSQNMFSLQGWRDFVNAAQIVFMSHWNLSNYLLVAIGAGIVFLRRPALFLFALWTFALWLFWYLVGNMNFRWGMTAFMLLVLMAYVAIVGLIDRCVEVCGGANLQWRPSTWSGVGEASHRSLSAWVTPSSVARIVVAVWALIICIGTVKMVRANGLAYAFPSWMSRDLARAVRDPGGFNAYLFKTLEGYEIYRYVGEHNLRMVLQPFDNGAGYYQAAFNDGKQGEWLFPWHRLPRSPPEYDGFLHSNNIRYFVYRPSLHPINVERLGDGSNNPRHAEMAYELMRYLLPGSRLILTDSFGWELREIAPDKLK
jgi:hypothetical protein